MKYFLLFEYTLSMQNQVEHYMTLNLWNRYMVIKNNEGVSARIIMTDDSPIVHISCTGPLFVLGIVLFPVELLL